jgi:hypothetical protein
MTWAQGVEATVRHSTINEQQNRLHPLICTIHLPAATNWAAA